MPRIFYLLLFLTLTLGPFPLMWMGQTMLQTSQKQVPGSVLPNNMTNQQSAHHSGVSFFPFWGGIFYYDSGRNHYGGRGRSWFSRSYDSYRSGGSGFKSFDDGGPGIFGK